MGSVSMRELILTGQIIGNTFPFVVFTSFGGFWIAFAILNDPSIGVAAAFSASGTNAVEGQANPVFAEGIAVYLICWGVLVFI
jgi:succinate-acetate transporter protein